MDRQTDKQTEPERDRQRLRQRRSEIHSEEKRGKDIHTQTQEDVHRKLPGTLKYACYIV